MKNKLIILSIIIVLMFAACDLGTDPEEPAVLGTEANPFLIKNVYDLASIGTGQTPNEIKGYEDWLSSSSYKLIADIDITASAKFSEWTPLCNDYPFTGNLDGDGYTISNMLISTANTEKQNYGLFAVVRNGTIKNLTIKGSITLDNSTGIPYYIRDTNIGGLIAFIDADTNSQITISNCHTDVNINTYGKSIGGLIGSSTREDNSCSVIITRCSASGNVIGGTEDDDFIGGLIGEAYGLTVEKSFATGSVQLREFSTGAGGFVGLVSGHSSFENCYASGDVSPLSLSIDGYVRDLGGFAGSTFASSISFSNCYASGSVSNGTPQDGFCSEGNITALNCFAKTATPETGITVLSDSNFKTETTFTNAGWDFDSIWAIDEGIGFPYLQ